MHSQHDEHRTGGKSNSGAPSPKGAPTPSGLDFEQLFLAFPDPTFIFDREGRYAGLNRVAAEALSTTPERMCGLHMHDVFPPDVAKFQLDAVMRVFETGEILWASEKPTQTKHGVRWYSTTLLPVKNARGAITHVMGVAHDITDRIRLQEEHARSAERAAESRKLETSGRLAGRLAHDFNNLLTVILGYTRLLLTQVPEDLTPQVAQIQKAAERAAELTGHLLAFSRRQVLARKVIDFNAMLRDMADVLASVVGDEIAVKLRLSPEPAHVDADIGQLEQVVLNFALNARDAMPDGGRITLKTARVVFDAARARRLGDLTPGPYIVFSFSDTGHGMDAKTREHLFEPFFTTKGNGRGTGLGLATVYGTVKQHHGHIIAKSAPGKGTTFTIYMPLVMGAATKAAPEEPLPASVHGNETVLVVEDEETVRDLVVAVLQRHGYRALAAATPAEALELWAKHAGKIDLCVTDVLMPGMNGQALAQRLRRDRPNLHVLFISAYADEEVFHKGLLPSGSRFLQKPFSVDAFLKALRASLEG